jgi:hypothetical protein
VVHEIASVEGVWDGEPVVRTVFTFERRVGSDGSFAATGHVPPVARVLADRGHGLPPGTFGIGPDGADAGID